jgi:predicted RNase H-like nuclease (RuvC/YqgF family)
LQETANGLEKTNKELNATANGFIDMLACMKAEESELRAQIVALTECNERFRTAIGALVTAGSQSADLTKMINDSLISIRELEEDIRDERKRQEAFTTHLTAAILAQMDANGDGSIDAIEQQKWLGKLAHV